MKKLDEIDAKVARGLANNAEGSGSIHYVAPAFISPEEVQAMSNALHELLREAKSGEHTEECSFITTYDGKSLSCDCYKFTIANLIAQNLGEGELETDYRGNYNFEA